jgi:hypothetical protein
VLPARASGVLSEKGGYIVLTHGTKLAVGGLEEAAQIPLVKLAASGGKPLRLSPLEESGYKLVVTTGYSVSGYTFGRFRS